MTNPIHISRKSAIRTMIFIIALITIYLILPKRAATKYDYSVGRIWNNDPIITSIEIPVFNDAERQKQIEDSLKSNFKPIYYRNNDVAAKVTEEYRAELAESPDLNLSAAGRNRLVAALEEIYDIGIYDSRGGAAPRAIRMHVTPDSVSDPVPAASFYTFASAHGKLRDAIKNDTALVKAVAKISPNIVPNIVYDSIRNQSELDIYEKYAQAVSEIVHAGTKIVDRGDLVTAHTYAVLQAYEAEMQQHTEGDTTMRLTSAGGTVALICIMLGLLYAYLYILRHDYFANLRVVLLLAVTVTAFVVFSTVLSESFQRGIYIVPFAMVPILLVVFLDSRTAFYSYMITLLLCSAVNLFRWEFIILQFAAGFVALVSIRDLSKRSQLLKAASLIFLTYALVYSSIELMQSGSVKSIDLGMFGAFFINALLISFAYILIFLIEKSFGFISRVTLVELSDINHPLLRELSQECPGTFQHSMAVSNLAASAASRLGANVQMVRAGALYHDIGKISNPAFFTENQHGINPHDSLSPEQSARIVIGHVTEGVRRADKAKLPSQLRDFILQHHGLGRARYFYTTYCNEHPDEDVDPAPFTYPGPNPQTIEASILMMADSVEAASRSLKDHSPQSIDALVNKIIDSQVAEGLHNDSPISFRDITQIKRSFASTLRTMYHSRISYPEAIKPERTANEGDQPPTVNQPND